MNTKKRMQTAFAVSAALLAGGAFAAGPTIKEGSVTFAQDAASRCVTIGYELEGAPAIVTVDILTNGVSIGAEHLTHMAGDVNRRVEAGAHVVSWQPCKAWRGNVVRDGSVTAKVSAWALNEPPPYMVVDLAVKGGNAVRYFARAEELPYGGVTNDAYKTDLLVLRKCPAENVTWRMGGPANEVGRIGPRETAHLVTLTNDFYIGVYPVTQKQYFNLMSTWPSFYTARREMRPVQSLSFNLIRGSATDGYDWPKNGSTVAEGTFLHELRKHTGGILFDLPLEAQWEFACRAGCGAALYNGMEIVSNTNPENLERLGRCRYSGGRQDGDVAYPADTDPDVGGTAIVGSFEPNAFGLYDMLGNVWEATRDWYQEILDDSVDPNVGPLQDTSKPWRVFRGGSIAEGVNWCRSASRGPKDPNANNKTSDKYDFGFRVALTVTPDAIP